MFLYIAEAQSDFHFLTSLSIENFLSRPKTLSHSQISSPTAFSASTKIKSLGKCPKTFFFMHSCILNLSFEVFEKILGFLVFLEIFGLCFVNLIINDHALHSCCILTMFHAFRCVFDYVETYAGRFGLGFTYDVFIFARHMFMHISCIRILSFLSFCFCL